VLTKSIFREPDDESCPMKSLKLLKSFSVLLTLSAMFVAPASIAQTAKGTPGRVAPASRLNQLERVLDFDVGTKPLFTDFQEDGGLNKSSRWYGLNIVQLNLEWGADGKVRNFILQPRPGSTIKEIRAAINRFCGLTDAAWTRNEIQGRMSAEAKNEKCEADYDNFVFGPGQLSLSIKRPE
jgi:hypothetical protein